MNNTGFLITQNEYRAETASFYETIFVLSNGLIGIRPTLDFNSAGARPGAYMSGIYDYALSVSDQIVNIPNPAEIEIIFDNELINLDFADIKAFKRCLHTDISVLITEYEIVLSTGITAFVKKKEFLTDDNEYCYLLSVTATEDVECRLSCALNFGVGNDYHGGYINQFIKTHHVILNDAFFTDTLFSAAFSTVKKKDDLYYECCLNCENAVIKPFRKRDKLGLSCVTAINGENTVNIRFISKIETKKEKIKDYKIRAFASLLDAHISTWREKWKQFEIIDFKNDKTTRNMVYSVYQMLAAYSDQLPSGANIPARGLSSGYHHGHFFFNTELYMVPWYAWFKPAYAKSLLMYRINTLDTAIKTSAELGFSGAFWSEESGVDGRPAGPESVIDYSTGEVFEEWTGRKVKHIGADVLYACHYYCKVTNDAEFERKYVIRLAKKVCEYYLSVLQYNDEKDCYEILDVIGPDEYHIGVNNNFYTNYMAGFSLGFLLSLARKYEGEVCKSLLEKVRMVQHKIVPPNERDGVIEQHDGYFDLADFPIEEYMSNGLPKISPRLEKAIFQFGNVEYNTVKQCDTVMLMSLFPEKFELSALQAAFEYYDKRTIHESSLSVSHAGIVAGWIGRFDLAQKYMEVSAGFNLDFEPRDYYNNGLHYAANAGAWLILLIGVLGLRAENMLLYLKEPTRQSLGFIKALKFSIWFCGREIVFQIKKDSLSVKTKDMQPLSISVNGAIYEAAEHIFCAQKEIF